MEGFPDGPDPPAKGWKEPILETSGNKLDSTKGMEHVAGYCRVQLVSFWAPARSGNISRTVSKKVMKRTPIGRVGAGSAPENRLRNYWRIEGCFWWCGIGAQLDMVLDVCPSCSAIYAAPFWMSM